MSDLTHISEALADEMGEAMIEFDRDRELSTGKLHESKPMRGVMIGCVLGAIVWAGLGVLVWRVLE